jgi:phage tail sheath gpL-like
MPWAAYSAAARSALYEPRAGGGKRSRARAGTVSSQNAGAVAVVVVAAVLAVVAVGLIADSARVVVGGRPGHPDRRHRPEQQQ